MEDYNVYLISDLNLDGKEIDTLKKFLEEKKGINPTIVVIEHYADAKFNKSVQKKGDLVVVCKNNNQALNEATDWISGMFTVDLQLNYKAGKFEEA